MSAPAKSTTPRAALPIGEDHALVDEITRPRILHLVTVEFASDGEVRDFRPLEWFGPELTADSRHTNQSIALRGLDEIEEAMMREMEKTLRKGKPE